MTLSIVIPVYNEIQTIGRILPLVAETLPEVTKEIIIVDDGSTDGTREWLTANLGQAGGRYAAVAQGPGGTLRLDEAVGGPATTFRVHFHARNRGKGGALRTGLALATGDVIVIQDADLEYDPQDWARMYPLIAARRVADVVYGSRFHGAPHRSLYFHHYLANRLISLLFNVIYNQTLTDIEVCYKMFTRTVRDSLALTCNDFGIEIELSAQVARNRRWRIYEVGIRYYGRTYEEGKKIGWKDGVKAFWYLLRFRFGNASV
ncbi:MAG: glycosyltransferase family 2 protein [Candidatus Lambdaproteobacteria bacterium]|nr:glycosyltransferase family 2 protein [Candidatus Lambdaproteobacteria bacterium]